MKEATHPKKSLIHMLDQPFSLTHCLVNLLYFKNRLKGISGAQCEGDCSRDCRPCGKMNDNPLQSSPSSRHESRDTTHRKDL